MEFSTQGEIKIHRLHLCPKQKEGPKELTAKPNKFHSALPKIFQRHSKYRLNSDMQVRASVPGALQQRWQALLIPCHAPVIPGTWLPKVKKGATSQVK